MIGNCQAGWAIMILAALRPELFGPIILAGSPLSYWAGVRGKNPMRYSGGLLGGSWLTALTSDLGHGKFDGAWLVQNFESQNPANTLWTKRYNLYSKIDTEAPRYLGFERWWGGHVNLNAEEIQSIVDDLFVGNKLAAGEMRTSDGTAIDLRNIRSPIVVFCSKGDNITPPQQALGWILDLYEDVDDIRSYGQTIVYTIHESVGHLGIFVSGRGRAQGARRILQQHRPDRRPAAGSLRSGVRGEERRTRSAPTSSRANGSCAARRVPSTTSARSAVTMLADERRFATAARVSEINLALYRAFAQPVVRAMTSAPDRRRDAAAASAAAAIRAVLRRESTDGAGQGHGRASPRGSPAGQRGQPVPGAAGNAISKQIVASLDAWRDMTESLSRANVPVDLRLARAAGRRRHRPDR